MNHTQADSPGSRPLFSPLQNEEGDQSLPKQHHEASVPALKPHASVTNSHVKIYRCKWAQIHVHVGAPPVHGCKQNLVLFLLQHVVLLGLPSGRDWGYLDYLQSLDFVGANAPSP